MIANRVVVYCIIIVVSLTLVSCYSNRHLFRRQSLNYESVDNPEFEHCNVRNFSRAFKMNMNYFKCQPREAVVHLYAKEHNVEMVPNKVVVKRCYESGCYGRNSCLPSKTKDVKVAVRLNDRVTKEQKCSWVTVSEHIECKCGCKMTKEHCEAVNKHFNPKECTCSCKNENGRKECLRQENMEWDEESCSCMCQTSFRRCSTGLEWVPSKCECMKVMSME